jgi:hypothetical protein
MAVIADSGGGFGPYRNVWIPEQFLPSPSCLQTQLRRGPGNEQDNNMVNCSRRVAVYALDNVVGNSLARLTHRSREKQG